MLFCVYNKVVAMNIRWQSGIVNTNHDWNISGTKSSGCNDGKSLCTSSNGTFSCAPPSIQLLGRWDELDTDKDGIWTRDEVIAEREDLSCKYVVDPLEVFNALVAFITERKQHLWIHPDVNQGVAIPKVYFTYIMGDIVMCGYRNGDMCGNLVQRGVFDSALDRIPRIGSDIMSALEYCHTLLDPGGLCQRLLPSTYSNWRIESEQECLNPSFSQFVYKDRNSGMPKSLLAVDYEAREMYETAQTVIFKLYKTSIIFLWILLVFSHLQEVGKTIHWVLQIPSPTQEELDNERAEVERATSFGAQRSALRSHETTKISRGHRVGLTIVTMARICMLCVLLYVGLSFLARQTDYIGLLLDGVALNFIVEVEKILYARVLRQEVRTLWEAREPVELVKSGLFARRLDLADIVWLCVNMIMAIAFMMYYTTSLVEPLYDALHCACLSEGKSCHEAHVFSQIFWNKYWRQDVPNAIAGIKNLKE